MPKTYLADKQTLDSVNSKVGASSDAESGTPTTLFAGLKNIIKGIIELKNLLSDGKTRVANAITGKGISTATNATFATMANNINAITTLSQGTGDANVSAYDIVSGKTAYARGGKVTGTLPEYGAYTASQSVAYGGDSLYVRIPQGAYRSNGGSGYPEITVHQNAVASSIGLSSDKIIQGNIIMGIAGSALNGSYTSFNACSFNLRVSLKDPKYTSNTITVQSGSEDIGYTDNSYHTIYGLPGNVKIIQLDCLLWFIDLQKAIVLPSNVATATGDSVTVRPKRNSYYFTFTYNRNAGSLSYTSNSETAWSIYNAPFTWIY